MFSSFQTSPSIHSKLIIEDNALSFLFENDFKGIFPELFLVLFTLLLLIYGVFFTTSKKLKFPILSSNLHLLSLQGFVFTLLLLVNNPIQNGVLLYNTFLLDYFTLFLKIVLIISAFFAVTISINYILSEKVNGFEYIILILLSTTALFFLVSAADFISLYLALELQSFCFYILAASKRNSEFSTEAGLKYFLLGAFSSGLLLFGCSLIYGFTGVTSFSDLAKLWSGLPQGSDLSLQNSILPFNGIISSSKDVLTNSGLENIDFSFSLSYEIGLIFIFSGFLFKITAVPFHMWAPDVYDGAPTSVTAFFAITPKIAILSVFLRIFIFSCYDLVLPLQKILTFCSIGSMILGALFAMSQKRIKRLLAFSSIGHVGYLLIGFCCSTIEGLQAFFFYLLIYVCMSISFFAVVLSPVRRDFVSTTGCIKYVADFTQAARTNPVLAITLGITVFSMAGIPPLAGFYSKALLFFSAMNSSLYLLAFVGVITSVISCYYYIRFVKMMYFEKPKTPFSFKRISRESSLVLGITFFFLLLFGLFPSPFYLITHKAALALSI